MGQNDRLAPADLDDIALAEEIEANCTGRYEWQVMNADETALCMWFTREEYLYPAMAAERWLNEHPNHLKLGYHVVERLLLTEREQLAREAAKRLRQAAAPQPNPTSQHEEQPHGKPT